MFLCFVIAWPISKLLDAILGEELANLYARGELKELVYLHGQAREDSEERLTKDEIMIIKGAMDMVWALPACQHLHVRDLTMEFLITATSLANSICCCGRRQKRLKRIWIFDLSWSLPPGCAQFREVIFIPYIQ